MYLNTGDDALFWTPPEAPAGVYGSFAPSPPLADFVARLHAGHEWVPPDAPVVERVLPDGGVLLVFNLGDGPAEPEGGTGYACEALGARCAPSIIRMAGRMEHASARLKPGGMAALLGLPAAELAGANVPLDALWGARAGQARERLMAAPRGRARAAVLDAILLERLGGRLPRPDPAAAEAVRRIEASGGRMRVRDLAHALGVGERRLGQIFERQVGLSPKALCRIARFHAAVSLLQRAPERSWTDVAYECGFYDQSHLVHEFQALAGLSPGEFRARGCGFFQDASGGGE